MASIFSTVGRARLVVAAWVPIVFQGDVLVDCGHRLRMELDPPGSDLVLNPRSASWRKSAVNGLNGRRAFFVIALSVATCERGTLKSRRFTALFSWTPSPEVP